jgi:hypothetical protein
LAFSGENGPRAAERNVSGIPTAQILNLRFCIARLTELNAITNRTVAAGALRFMHGRAKEC